MLKVPSHKAAIAGEGVRLTRCVFTDRLAKPVHSHDTAHIFMVFSGRWRDVCGSCERTLGPGELLLHPPGTTHENGVLTESAEVIVAELLPAVVEAYEGHNNGGLETILASFEEVDDVPDRLRSEMLIRDRVTPLVLVTLCVQLIAIASRLRQAPHAKPLWLRRVASFVQANLSGSLTVPVIARIAGLSRAQLMRVFPAATGYTVQGYVREYRIRAAARALRDSSDSIQEIAFSTGFFDQAHLSRTFKKSRGMTPREYRKAHSIPRADQPLS